MRHTNLSSIGIAAIVAAAFAPIATARDAAHATQRIAEGETIRLDVLTMRPSASPAGSVFGVRRDVAGRVALAPIGEGDEIRREQVGDVPACQFRIGTATPLRVEYLHATGPVLPNARRSVTCTLDTATLPETDAAALRDAVRDSGVLLADAQEFDLLVGGGNEYRLRMTVGTTTKTVHWSERLAPQSVWPLVRRFEACAAP